MTELLRRLFRLLTGLSQKNSSIQSNVLYHSIIILIISLASNVPNWEALKQHMYKEGRVSKEHCMKILRDTLTLISKLIFIYLWYMCPIKLMDDLVSYREGAKSVESA